MPWLIRLLLGGLLEKVGEFVLRAMVAAGVSAVTYYGISESLDFASTFITARWSGLPSTALGILGALGIGRDIGIVIGAVTARLALSGLTASGLTKWVARPKA